MNRRTFLTQSAQAAAAYSSLPLLSALLRTEPYKLAIIGTGWWGMNILREAIKDKRCKTVAMCDVDGPALKKAVEEIKQLTGDNPKAYPDYREMIDKEQPELVIIATPDHWHALNAIYAIESGAHVFLEKPIAHTINEGKAILAKAREYERVVQVDTHRRLSPHNIAAMDFLRGGKAGNITSVKAFVNYHGGPGQITPNEEAPKDLDWDMWCGPAPYRDYNPRIHPKGFRNFLDYANGQIADWGIHWFDQVLWWTEEKYPKTVYSTGGRYIKKDNTDAPDTHYAMYEFESFTMHWESKLVAGNSNEPHNVGCYFYGTEGTMHLGWRDGWTFYPRDKKKEKVHMEPTLHKPDDQNIRECWADFMNAIEKEQVPVNDIENGYLATNISLLGVLSYKLGRSIEWDGEKGEVIKDKEANKMLQRKYRGDWKYPKV